jgi:hypothetical protein
MKLFPMYLLGWIVEISHVSKDREYLERVQPTCRWSVRDTHCPCPVMPFLKWQTLDNGMRCSQEDIPMPNIIFSSSEACGQLVP